MIIPHFVNEIIAPAEFRELAEEGLAHARDTFRKSELSV